MATTKTTTPKKRLRLPVPAGDWGLMNREQVCESLGGGSLSKLKTMIRAGEFPPPDKQFGKSPRWSVKLVATWVRGEWKPGGE